MRQRIMGWTGRVLVLVALVGTGALFFSGGSGALPAGEIETYYWPNNMPASEATFSNYVGWKFIGCGGERIIEGTRTGNMASMTSPCSGSSLGTSGCYVDGFGVSCGFYTRIVSIVCNSSYFTCT